MCLSKQRTKSLVVEVSVGWNALRLFLHFIPLMIFTLAISSIGAQARTEDYILVKNWTLPTDAVAMSELEIQDKLLYRDQKPFSGWAVELYPTGELLRASEYLDGRQHGLSLLWYPDGSPQMSATYRLGSLHGRFLGWYQNGSVIYDMYINRGTYASDNLAGSEDQRQEDTEIFEMEGNTDDGTRE